MATVNIPWTTGSGDITVDYGGSKDGMIIVTSDSNNLYESRSQQIKVKTTDGSNIERTVTVQQAAKVRTNISSAIVTAPTQTYSGVAKTPLVTVTLNSEVVPSTGYDVSYSDNTNAGTATITVTGKNDYTGTATGTFTINKVTPTVVAPTAKVLTYNETAQALVNAGSTDFGTLKYSLDNSTWSTSIPTATNQGSYTVYYKVEGDSNVNSVSSSSVACSINEKQVTATVILSESSYTYDGNAKQPTVTVKDGSTIIPPSEYSVSYSNNTNAGTATVTITDNVGGNYEVIGSATFTINKASGSVNISGVSSSYSGSSQSLASVSGATGTMHYSTDYSNWSTSIPAATNAGSWTIYWYMDASTNYEGISASTSRYVSSSIAKINPTITAAPTNANPTYNGSAQYLLTGGTANVGGSFSYSTGTNAGSYTATWWFTPNDTTNYNSLSDYVAATIAKASRTLSFADSYAVLNTSSSVTKTAAPSAGSGDGAITYSISSTTYATINSSTGAVTSKTSDGSAVVTATIAEGTNYLSATASYNLYVFATTHNYDYNGSYRSITLPPGTYQFQCWGAQGGSNAAASSYGITAKAGGKGGYSVGQLTVAQETSARVYVGGQGSSSAGGFNGGGSTTGSASYNSGNEQGVSRMGGGGGATDIRLSNGNLLSRMIVAGGGAGGAMTYRAETTSTTYWKSIGSASSGTPTSVTGWREANAYLSVTAGDKVWFKATRTAGAYNIQIYFRNSSNAVVSNLSFGFGSYFTFTVPSGAVKVQFNAYTTDGSDPATFTVSGQKEITTTTTNTSNDSQVGGVGGGTQGGAYSSTYAGKQNAAGSGGSFGQGAAQSVTDYRYCSGAGGGGWYGGGSSYSDSSMTSCKYGGGGSGWVNIAANAGNRPSGYTGLELDSGSTTAGSSSFPATGGGNETGHAGNGYARITRIS